MTNKEELEFKGLNVIKCPVCGRDFLPAPYHAYKIQTKLGRKRVCSWKCLRQNEKKLRR